MGGGMSYQNIKTGSAKIYRLILGQPGDGGSQVVARPHGRQLKRSPVNRKIGLWVEQQLAERKSYPNVLKGYKISPKKGSCHKKRKLKSHTGFQDIRGVQEKFRIASRCSSKAKGKIQKKQARNRRRLL